MKHVNIFSVLTLALAEALVVHGSVLLLGKVDGLTQESL